MSSVGAMTGLLLLALAGVWLERQQLPLELAARRFFLPPLAVRAVLALRWLHQFRRPWPMRWRRVGTNRLLLDPLTPPSPPFSPPSPPLAPLHNMPDMVGTSDPRSESQVSPVAASDPGAQVIQFWSRK